MPDYNPAVAAGIKPPENNFANTLGTIANLQVKQALTGYYTLQGLQQQRQYDALQAYAGEMRTSGNSARALQAYSDHGGNPEGLNQLAGAASQMTFMGQHGGLNPQGAEANANIALRGAETVNAQAQTPGIAAKSDVEEGEAASRLSNAYIKNPNDANWQAIVDHATKYHSQMGGRFIADIDDPAQRMQVAQSQQQRGLSSEQALTPHPISPESNIVTLGGNSQPVAATGGAPNTPQSVATQKGFGAENVKDIKEANDKFNAANDTQQGLLNIRNNLNTMGSGGFLTPGSSAGKRVAIAKAVNTAAQAVTGQTIFPQDKVAAAEAATKGTVNLGFNLARTLGSREAQMIVQQSIGVQPGIEQTPEGNRRIMATLLVAAQRDKDHAAFARQYIKDNPSAVPGDADMAFNQAHPVSSYVADVGRLEALDQQRDKNGKSPIDRLAANPSGLAKDFNTHFFGGENMARYFGAPQ